MFLSPLLTLKILFSFWSRLLSYSDVVLFTWMSSRLYRFIALIRKLLIPLLQFSEIVGILKTQREITCWKHLCNFS